MKTLDRVYWADIATFGGFEDYNVIMFSGTLGRRHGNGYICVPDTGSPRWVSDTLVRSTMAEARERAVIRLEVMRGMFARKMNTLIRQLKSRTPKKKKS